MSISSKFENLSLGDTRPTQLIRRYGNLYTEARLDAFDALDTLPEISDFDDLKGKLLFSVVVVSEKSLRHFLDSKLKLRIVQLHKHNNLNWARPVWHEKRAYYFLHAVHFSLLYIIFSLGFAQYRRHCSE